MKQNYMARKTHFTAKKTGISVLNPPLALLNQALSFMPTSLRTSRHSTVYAHNCRLFAATQLLSIGADEKACKNSTCFRQEQPTFDEKSSTFSLLAPCSKSLAAHAPRK